MATGAVTPQREPTEKEIRLVIAASSAGTIFEWYDFFIYGTLAGLIGAAFFPSDNETLEILLVWAGFAVGFGFRPLGAIPVRLPRRPAGAQIHLPRDGHADGHRHRRRGPHPQRGQHRHRRAVDRDLPARPPGSRARRRIWRRGDLCRRTRAAPEKRGFYTSFIQASVVGGFVLSILVVIACRAFIPAQDFAEWGWRIPFLLSIVLLFISLWMRLKLSESPVFQAMKAAGETSANPFKESLTYPGNPKRIFVALFRHHRGAHHDLVTPLSSPACPSCAARCGSTRTWSNGCC